ncbi:MAG: phosphoribosylanthranilate isomerase [Pseudomonadota bacterium]
MDIKICGLSTTASIDAVAAGGAQFAGFILFEKSPRHLEIAQAADLMAHAKAKGLQTVAVTVNADDDYLLQINEEANPDVLQLHGAETVQRLADVKARFGKQTWKALAVSSATDLEKLDPYRGEADRFLLDAKPPKGSDLPGGNAVSFDWSILSQLSADTDYLLAGGVDVNNLAQAMSVSPPGLDLSSGVESAPGVKDIGKINAFFEAVRAA